MRRALWSLGVVLFCTTPAYAVAPPEDGATPLPDGEEPATGATVAVPPGAPAAVQQVGLDERLGQTLPMDVPFTDETGRQVRLRDYFNTGQPVVLAPAYFHCKTICDLLQRDLAYGLRHTPLELGRDYRVVTISIDPRDGTQAAAVKQQGFLEPNGLYDKARSWPFLTTSDDSSIRRVMDALGYRYAYDKATDQYAHPAVIAILTPEGKIARYLYGIQFSPRDLRLGLLEAGAGHIGGVVDRVLLTCFHYDPSTRRYGVYVFGVLKIGGALVMFIVGGMVILLWRLDRRRRRTAS